MSLPDFLPPIAAIPSIEPAGLATAPASPVGALQVTPSSTFGQLVSAGVEQVNQSLLDAQVDMQRIASGDVGSLHQVMLKLEESRLSFQLMLQVRNRLLESYQDVMRMQV